VIDSGRFRSGKAGILPLLAVALSLGACAANSYMGIPLAPGAAEAGLQRIAERARDGDKQAQLELGLKFEKGIGVPSDAHAARAMFARAARDSGGVIWIYSPPVRKGESGRLISVDSGPKIQGLREAKARLENVD
jgi:hypothetical protein